MSSDMSEVRRPSRPRKGLIFSSTSQKRKSENDDDDDEDLSPPPKRNQPDEVTPSSPSNSSTRRIKTRILVLSDTHGHSHLPHPLSPDLKIDVVLHCGDLSQCGSLEDYRATIQLLESIPAPLKLVIAGNHDLTLDHRFWSSNSTHEGRHLYDAAKSLFVSPSVKEARIRLLGEGAHDFVLENGAGLRVFVSPFTPNHSRVPEWAFGYPSNYDRFNPEGKGISYGNFVGTPQSMILNSDEKEIDVVMTHTPPRYRLDQCWTRERLGCLHLFRAIRRVRPKLHAFGHVHEGNGAEIIFWGGKNGGKLPMDDDIDDVVVGKLMLHEVRLLLTA